MVKKGKYKLFSYLIENYLIYYKSLTKNTKVIAFAILEYSNYKSIESILNDFLRKRVIQYYSIQIETFDKNKKILLLNFEEDKKESIIKSFNNVQQILAENHKFTKFQKEKDLEDMFLAILFQHINSNTCITKSSNSIIISTENKSKSLNFFTIDLAIINKEKSFVSSFLNLITDYGKIGYLIFNIKLGNRENIIVSPYFVVESNNIKNPLNIEEKVNDFFQCNLLKMQNFKLNSIFNLLWRLQICDNSFFFNDYHELFYSKNYTNSLDLLEMNEFFEKQLLNNQIDYTRLSKNLLFIEKRYLFLILQDLDCDYIYRIIEKYYPKYFIYILMLNNLGYTELQQIKSVKSIETIKILNPLEIHKFNYEEFKSKDN
ncbi:MAG: hypothetical protein ACFFB6_08670 [Promethearchaeota archaeon]